MDLHLHPVREDGVSVEVIDSAGVELGLLRSDGQVLLGSTRNLAADRLKGKNSWWAASCHSLLAAEGTSRLLLKAGKAGIPHFVTSSCHRDTGRRMFSMALPMAPAEALSMVT